MKLYQPGDVVEVDVDSGKGIAPNWVRAVVTNATDPRHGWTAAATTDPWHPRIQRGPGWNQDEIREVNS